MITHTIDATGQSLGRVASEAAAILRGKGQPSFAPWHLATVRVVITNAAKLKLTPARSAQTRYSRYSGYPGGLKFISLAELVAKHGYGAPLRQAVRGMLPANKLRPRLLKHLVIRQ